LSHYYFDIDLLLLIKVFILNSKISILEKLNFDKYTSIKLKEDKETEERPL